MNIPSLAESGNAFPPEFAPLAQVGIVNTVDAAQADPVPDLVVLVKPCKDTSPISIPLKDLGAWSQALVTSAGVYAGSHYYPPGPSLPVNQVVPGECDPREFPCYYHFRFECDGKSDTPLVEACTRMTAALTQLKRLKYWWFLSPESIEKHFTFFSTGQRSIYAVARSCSANAAIGWDRASTAIMQAINTAAGTEIIDLQIYNTPKAPARAYHTSHEKGTYFNAIPFDWVATKNVARIQERCSGPATDDWARSWIETVGIRHRAGGPVYDALTRWIARTRFESEANDGARLPRLPSTRRHDYAALIKAQGHRIARVKQLGSTSYIVLDTCPYCGKRKHAVVSEFGNLKCKADSCPAAKGVAPKGEAGWLLKVGIVLDDADDDDSDLQDDTEVDHYPDAVNLTATRDALDVRAELRISIEDFLEGRA